MRKYLYGAAALALLGTGFWFGRSRVGSALGSPVDVVRQAAAAATQIARATAGSPLTDYRKGEDNALFFSTPSTNTDANRVAAYWLAVASRLLKNRAMALQAGARLAQANVLSPLPNLLQPSGSVSTILGSAAASIRQAAGNNRQAGAVATILEHMATPGAQQVAQQIRGDRQVLTNTASATASDVASLPARIVAAAGNALAPVRWAFGFGEWWQVWGSRFAVVGAGFLAWSGLRWWRGRRAPAAPTSEHAGPAGQKLLAAPAALEKE